MTIGNFIIRVVVACGLVFTFIVTCYLYSNVTVYQKRIDAITCMGIFVFAIFAYLLWIIK